MSDNKDSKGDFSLEDIIAEVKGGAPKKPSEGEKPRHGAEKQTSPQGERPKGRGQSEEDEDEPRVIPFRAERRHEPSEKEAPRKSPTKRRVEEEAAEEAEPVMDEEADFEDAEERAGLYYDFLNIDFDEPTAAVKALGRKAVNMAARMTAIFIMTAVTAYLAVGPLFGLPGMPQIGSVAPQVISGGVQTACAFLSLLLCWEPLTAGIWRIFRLRPTLDSLTAFSGLCITLHSLLLTLGLCPGESLAAVSCMNCLFALAAKRHRATGLRRVYKCMEMSASPAAVKVTGGRKFPTAIKTHTNAVAEVSDAVGMDMTERTSGVFAPLAIVASGALAAAAAFVPGRPEIFPWALASISAVTAPAALCMSSVRPWGAVSKRLFTSGAAILNYRAAVRLSKAHRVGIADSDLFPLGSVHIAGMKIMTAAIPMEQVVADAAAVMSEVSGGVGKAFGDFAREQYLAPRKAMNVRFFPGGGISAQVREDYVLMGSADFLRRMGVSLKEPGAKNGAVYMAVNSYEAAIFTLKYSVQPQPYTALGILSKYGVVADLAVRDFTITEQMIERRFAIKRSLVNIPPFEVQEAYLSDRLAWDEPPCAILTRDSFSALAETIGGAKCITRAVRINLFCAYACAVIGMITMYFLAVTGHPSLASAANIALYLFIWYIPVWFTGAFMTRY